MVRQKIANWGNCPVVEATLTRIAAEDDARTAVGELSPVIGRGMGRCYGDSSLGEHILDLRPLDKLIDWNPETGVLVCEAGVTLSEILDLFVPRGWFPSVTPGTKFITVGGAIAANVHGKNHHAAGCFGDHVHWMDLLTASGEVLRCTPEDNRELFETTCGGMGLTGLILRAAIQLQPVHTAFIREETVVAHNLDEIMGLFESSGDWTYSVAWIDCLAKGLQLGRSVMMRGEHAEPGELPLKYRRHPLDLARPMKLNVPFPFPGFALNSWTVSLFNWAIYHKYRNQTHITSLDTFFYPLDAIHNWNRIYGRRGFTQYQCVLPTEAGRDGMASILKKIAASGMGSFLAVLKLFGDRNDHDFISFPRSGYTLALDFPVTPKLEKLFVELDAVVRDHGGRLYLAKDMRMSGEMFRVGYPNAQAFRERLVAWDPDHRFRSRQSDRLEITP